MTPQSSFMVIAPVVAGREDSLRRLLGTLNRQPGMADPENDLIPFGKLKDLHFARLMILDDQTLDDITLHGLPRVDYPVYLAFLADCDGPLDEFRAALIQHAAAGLHRMFLHCDGFTPETDVRSWVMDHEVSPATSYVNWIGRTVQQIREEQSLRVTLGDHIRSCSAQIARMPVRKVHTVLRDFILEEEKAGRLALTPPRPTPPGWQLRNALHLIGVPLLLLLLSPLLLLYAPLFFIQLRMRERADPQYAPRIVPDHARELTDLEDYDVTNQFSALGSIKPGIFRAMTLRFFLWSIDYTTRHIFNRGRLARVSTIHFARWVFLDRGKRLLFASNYDGSLDSYMDDFINKVAFGLNLVFSNGIGYPTTDWLITNGARDEQKFKYYIRRHELPSEVWYKAYPGLTALDLQRNALIRQGLEKTSPTDDEIRQWLQLL